MSSSDIRECEVHCGGRRSSASEPLITPYLLGAAAKCDEELKTCKDEELKKILVNCRAAAVRMLGLVY